MDKNNYAELEKEYSKLAAAEETLRKFKEMSEKNESVSEECSQTGEESISADAVTDTVSPEKTLEESTEKSSEKTLEESPNLKNVNEALPFFFSVKNLGAELSEYWKVLTECFQTEDFRKAGLIITSIPGNGRTTLGKMIGESVITAQRNSVKDGLLVTNAEEFNVKDIPGLYKQYANGCIIVENADRLSKESAQTLKVLMSIGTRHPLFILETLTEKKNDLRELLGETAEYVTNDIKIPVFDDNTLAEFAVYYANSLEFDIDRVALLAVHRLIENRQSHSHHVNLAEVAEIVDNAASRYGKNLFKKLIFSKTRHELERPVLSERDFEHI